jgi:NifB/MoaA-like Fe-S oxidoreductase
MGPKLPKFKGRTLHDVLDVMWIGDGKITMQDFPDFEGPLFDGVHRCRNSCVFCFVDMMPPGMRESLYIKDDDFRLSFLQGNFITLTNINDEELVRITSQRLMPLHVSLHAVDPDVRTHMMGKNQGRGIYVLERLLDEGIDLHAQIVLMPG